jgi:hypothetical protein
MAAKTTTGTWRETRRAEKRGGYSGSGDAHTMKPPAKLPSAAIKPKTSKTGN